MADTGKRKTNPDTRESSNEGRLEDYTSDQDLESDTDNESTADLIRKGKRAKHSPSVQASSAPSDSNDETEAWEPLSMPVKDLICEIQLSAHNRLVISYESGSKHFPKLDHKEDELLNLTDRNEHTWQMTLTYDIRNHYYVIDVGLVAYLNHFHLYPRDRIRIYLPAQKPKLKGYHFCIQHKKMLGRSLFVVKVPRSNKLTIPWDMKVLKCDPQTAMPPPDHLKRFPLHLIDHLSNIWEMEFIRFEDEEAYVVYTGWEEFATRYRLSHKDSVRFFEGKANTEDNSFIIFPEPGPEVKDNLPPPVFEEKNLVSKYELTPADVAITCMPIILVKLAFMHREREMVKVTDENNKSFYVIIWYLGSPGSEIEHGFDAIVQEHKLRGGDMVRLYTCVGAEHRKQLLIKCIKKPGMETVTKSSAGSGSGNLKGKDKL